MAGNKRVRGWAIAAIVLGLLACGLCLAAIVWAWQTLVGPPPGVGPKAERGYRACEPIIAALARYSAEHDRYPASLADLAPTYLDSLPGSVDGVEIRYSVVEPSYRLEFRYAGPGMNVCTYTPEQGWHCYGYY